MTVDPERLRRVFVAALVEAGSVACDDYPHRTRWTRRATAALIDTALVLFPGSSISARNRKDAFLQSEYLGLDVTACRSDLKWGAILFAAEHENEVGRAAYSTWKVLCVQAQMRVVVAYFGAGTAHPTFDALAHACQEVRRQVGVGSVVLIGGEYFGKPKRIDDFDKLFKVALIG